MSKLTAEQIIEMNSNPVQSILVETILEHKEALLKHYTDEFPSEPLLMVTDVFNAAQYAKIVPADELGEALDEYLGESDEDADEEDLVCTRETILFNSNILLKDL